MTKLQNQLHDKKKNAMKTFGCIWEEKIGWKLKKTLSY